MKVHMDINPGVCGFTATVDAESPDSQMVNFKIQSDCSKVQALAAMLAQKPVDAFAELGAGSDGVILSAARETQKGNCAACAVTLAIFKGFQVVSGLALTADIAIAMTKEG